MMHNGFVYEQNNFTALVEKQGAPLEFHTMMDFISNCKLGYAMLESPILYCEIVEEVWTIAVFDSGNKVLTFNVNGKPFSVNNDMVTACLKLPENNCIAIPTQYEIVSLLNSIGYSLPTDNLGKIVRKGMRKEWSFLSDAFIKVISGKISDFDAVTSNLVEMLCGSLRLSLVKSVYYING